MASSLSNHVKEFMKLSVNMDTMIKKCGTYGITYKVCDCFYENTNFKVD